MTISTKLPVIQLKHATVLFNKEIAPGIFLLAFLRNFEFNAGQVIGVGLNPKDEVRLYNICSGTSDDEVQILYNLKPDGKLTPPLSTLNEGDQFYVSPPFGSFYGTEKPAYWIAAGTGLAPFYSMFRSGYNKNKILLHGGRTSESFYFSHELSDYFGSRYIRCCSSETGPGLFPGRVTNYLQSRKDLPRNHLYYLCGSPEMVIDCREILLEKGIPFDHIIAEIYF